MAGQDDPEKLVSFSDAYDWLNLYPVQQTYLRDTNQQLAARMTHALNHYNYKGAELFISFLVESAETMLIDVHSVWEIPQIWVECALGCYRMKDLEAAIRYLRRAIPAYEGYGHNKAVVQWMLGAVYFDTWIHDRDALRYWNLSVQAFPKLIASADGKPAVMWYKEQQKEMFKSIRKAIQLIEEKS